MSDEPIQGRSGTRLCMACGYDLRATADDACPECGRSFDLGDPSTYIVRTGRPSGGHVFVGVSILVTLLVALAALGGRFWIFIDIPSIIWMLGVLIGGLWMTHGPVVATRSLCRAFLGLPSRSAQEFVDITAVLDHAYQLAWGGGLVGFLVGLICMLADLSDPVSIGAGIAVALLTVLYGAVLAEFLFSPLLRATEARANLVAGEVAVLSSRTPHRIRATVLIVVLAVISAAFVRFTSFSFS